MNLKDCAISLSPESSRTGWILVGDKFRFEIDGGGVGYRIRVRSATRTGTLRFLRDGSCSATTGTWPRRRRYEMSDCGVSNRSGEVLRLIPEGNFEAIEDTAAVALFVINHFFWNKTGVFEVST